MKNTLTFFLFSDILSYKIYNNDNGNDNTILFLERIIIIDLITPVQIVDMGVRISQWEYEIATAETTLFYGDKTSKSRKYEIATHHFVVLAMTNHLGSKREIATGLQDKPLAMTVQKDTRVGSRRLLRLLQRLAMTKWKKVSQ